MQDVEEILQQIYPNFCIEVVRQFRLDFNVNGGDLCNDKDDVADIAGVSLNAGE
jgi:hypothetical protein